MRTTVARRVLAATALAIGLPLATAGVAAAQSAPSGPGDPSGPSAPSGPDGGTDTPGPVGAAPDTARPGTGGLARTGGEAAIPLAASAAAITIVLGGRRLASRFGV